MWYNSDNYELNFSDLWSFTVHTMSIHNQYLWTFIEENRNLGINFLGSLVMAALLAFTDDSTVFLDVSKLFWISYCWKIILSCILVKVNDMCLVKQINLLIKHWHSSGQWPKYSERSEFDYFCGKIVITGGGMNNFMLYHPFSCNLTFTQIINCVKLMFIA